MLTNQPENKKSPARKSPAKKRTTKKRKAKAPKIKLAKNKVYAAAAIIISICVLSLATSVFLSREAEKTSRPAEKSPSVSSVKVPESAVSQGKNPQPLAAAHNSAQNQKSLSSIKTEIPKGNTPAKSPEKQVPKSENSAKKNLPPVQTKVPPLQEKLPQKSEKSQAPKSQAKTKIQPSTATVASIKHSESNVKIPSEKSPTSLFNIPPARRGATLVFVIDDGGQNVWNVKKYVSLPFPITIAVLPKLPHSRECADAVRAAGKELMLHQPMQAVNLKINPGAGKISPEMSTYEVAAVIKENLAELGPGVKGFNNHEGSLITGDVIKMGAVLETAAERGLYFLDSRTTSASMARQAALERDMSILERNAPFLDNAVNRDQMLSEILKSLEVANKSGHAIIIGHVDKSAAILPDLLKEMYPELLRAGYKFATPSQIR